MPQRSPTFSPLRLEAIERGLDEPLAGVVGRLLGVEEPERGCCTGFGAWVDVACTILACCDFVRV